jgi:cell division protein FtsN
VSDSRQRLAARDYKNAGGVRRPGFDFNQYRQFGIGLGVGLAIALFVWLYDHRVKPKPADDLTEVAAPQKQQRKASSVEDEGVDAAENFAFYDALPKAELNVPEVDRPAKRAFPDQPVTQPGVYVLQVASYRSRPDAERQRDKLAKLGIDATIQHVTIDTDEYHRVRVGPISDLAKLNDTRRRLRAADIDAQVYPVTE